LKLHIKATRKRIEKNAGNAAWGQLEARWELLVYACKAELAEQETSGRAFFRPRREAAVEIVKVARDVKPREVVEVVLALYLMAELEPHRFRSDRAFLVQMVRRVRALTERNLGVYWDHQAQRNKRVYREMPPRASAMMGHWLAENLGVGGLWVARLERQQAEAKVEERRALGRALGELR
jgi:hypothetical protein